MKKNNCVLEYSWDNDYFKKSFFDRINQEIILAEVINKPVEVSLSLVDDATIRQYNAQFRNKDTATDVLAFAEKDKEVSWPDEKEKNYLGEILISVDTAKKQAKEHKHSLSDEVAWLYIHGFLHLLGYDHEISKKEAQRMGEKTQEIFLNIKEK
ncbi:rRNA maturation RNase YbeY [Patescibacteria group bacterium]|nr:rRNA maturation RNase YbeY [Patescibacteria group bacterium]